MNTTKQWLHFVYHSILACMNIRLCVRVYVCVRVFVWVLFCSRNIWIFKTVLCLTRVCRKNARKNLSPFPAPSTQRKPFNSHFALLHSFGHVASHGFILWLGYINIQLFFSSCKDFYLPPFDGPCHSFIVDFYACVGVLMLGVEGGDEGWWWWCKRAKKWQTLWPRKLWAMNALLTQTGTHTLWQRYISYPLLFSCHKVIFMLRFLKPVNERERESKPASHSIECVCVCVWVCGWVFVLPISPAIFMSPYQMTNTTAFGSKQSSNPQQQ